MLDQTETTGYQPRVGDHVSLDHDTRIVHEVGAVTEGGDLILSRIHYLEVEGVYKSLNFEVVGFPKIHPIAAVTHLWPERKINGERIKV